MGEVGEGGNESVSSSDGESIASSSSISRSGGSLFQLWNRFTNSSRDRCWSVCADNLATSSLIPFWLGEGNGKDVGCGAWCKKEVSVGEGKSSRTSSSWRGSGWAPKVKCSNIVVYTVRMLMDEEERYRINEASYDVGGGRFL